MKLNRIIFGQADAAHILAAVRISVAIVVAAWVLVGPFPTFYPEEELLLYSPTGIRKLVPPFGPNGFRLIKICSIVGAVGMLFSRVARLSTWLTTLNFFALTAYVSNFDPLWNYNTHLNFALAALCFGSDSFGIGISNYQWNRTGERTSERESAMLFYIRLNVAFLYMQASLSKILNGGLAWLRGDTIFVQAFLHPGVVSDWIVETPWAPATLATLSVLGEASLLPLLLWDKTRGYGAIFACLMHLSIWMVMEISFWHLWVLFPALFLCGRYGRASTSGVCRTRLDSGSTATA